METRFCVISFLSKDSDSKNNNKYCTKQSTCLPVKLEEKLHKKWISVYMQMSSQKKDTRFLVHHECYNENERQIYVA